VGPNCGGGAGSRIGVGFDGNPSGLAPRILAVLFSFSPRIVQADTERHVLVECIRGVTTDEEVLDLVSEATVEGGYLRLLIPIEYCHITDKTGMVGSARLGALLYAEELTFSRRFGVGVLERSMEPPDELGPRGKGNGAIFLIDVRGKPFLGWATEEVARV
jgi:hypothetical protein